MKKRMLEVFAVCLFLILESWAASFYARTQETVQARPEREAQEASALVWSESVMCGESACQMTFERISPLYAEESETSAELFYLADYRLSLRDADGALLTEQVVAGFPVRFEEVYWIQDFSGDGAADLAFCTTYESRPDERQSHITDTFFIWNTEQSRYETSELPLEAPSSYTMVGVPLWNEDLSCVIAFNGKDFDTAQPVLEMYSFSGGEWRIVRRLESIGIEGEYYADHLTYSGERRELLYENGELAGETTVESNYGAGTIWCRADSVWSRYYQGNLCLYPDERYWRMITTSMDGLWVEKYVRRDAGTFRREYDSWHDMLGDWESPYVDEGTFAFLKDAYAEVDFSGQYEAGDEDTDSLFLDAFDKLLRGDALLTDGQTGETMLLSEIPFFEKYDLESEAGRDADSPWGYTYYFFDMDGDGEPELTVYRHARGFFVLDYDAGTDTYSVWYDAEACWYGLLGSRKVLWTWDGRYLEYCLLDESGEAVCQTFCGSWYYNGEEAIYLVMLPRDAEEIGMRSVSEEMQEQGMFSRADGQWYFRVTGEQYEEITKSYWDAYDLANEHMDQEAYTYEELFGALGETRAGHGQDSAYFDAGSRLGTRIAAYRVQWEDVKVDRQFKDGDYIAIEDLDSGVLFYVPDEYDELVDIQVTEAGICIRDRDFTEGTLREHRIPGCFLFSKEYVLNVCGESGYNRYLIMEGTERVEALPQQVWQERFMYGTESLEVTFERVSPLYSEGFSESAHGLMADYCLTVRNEEGEVVSAQKIASYPVAFEQVHWLIDFSEDGFPDLAFCTSLVEGTYYHSARTHFLIWNAKTQAYEEKPLPENEHAENRFSGFVYWVPTLSAVWTDIASDEYGNEIDGMFSYKDSEWQLIGRQEPIYSETETFEDPRRDVEYPAVEAYREQYYQNGEPVAETRREQAWDGSQGRLYPRGDEWTWGEAEIGGRTIGRYFYRCEPGSE